MLCLLCFLLNIGNPLVISFPIGVENTQTKNNDNPRTLEWIKSDVLQIHITSFPRRKIPCVNLQPMTNDYFGQHLSLSNPLQQTQPFFKQSHHFTFTRAKLIFSENQLCLHPHLTPYNLAVA